ncbi:methyltransferase domain-containing protein [Thalassobaculum sp. OXR-137]|uniref:methyltransferase domain-containing protein n=1 Tax=Thalassobaculum sp. OXR-137 TaxID=3100173 RepID=UPI002AC9AC4A|nr:methyltransferase domain-containing protein [Thalassobaculum sp. OXR-137]WPZ36197.1 methyltransferase domain-containing protein [Thalassobaculum sp. OXR-137]
MTNPSGDTAAQSPKSSYYSNVNQDLLQIVPATAERVYEFGCGEGRLGWAYKTWNPGAEYIGIELFPDAAAKAREVLDAVHEGSAEDPSVTTAALERHGLADALVYGDVLEHLVDPWAALKDHLRLLKDDGVVCICVPNAQHWMLSLNLMAGHFEYQDSGLHDRTHLRFFTGRSLRRFVEGAGLTMKKLHRRRIGTKPPAELEQICRTLADAKGVPPQDLHNDLLTFQYVVQAQRPTATPPMQIDFKKLADRGGFNFTRVAAPARAFNSVPGVSVAVHGETASISAHPEGPNIFVWQRPILRLNRDPAQIEILRRRRKLIVTDFDDDPDLWREIPENRYLSFLGAHVVQVSTESLVQKIKQWNPNTFLVPNRVPQIFSYAEARAQSEPNTIFIGGFNRGPDFEAFAETVNAFAARSARDWRFLVVGDETIFSALTMPNKEFFRILPYDQYMAVMRRADLALLPCADSAVNAHKSNLKFMEAAAGATVAIASRNVYGASVSDGATGFLFDTPDDLARVLEQIDGHPDLEPIRARAYDQARRDFALSPSIAGVLDLYRTLYDQYDALDRQLAERLATLLDRPAGGASGGGTAG